jgi:hypothetical protein
MANKKLSVCFQTPQIGKLEIEAIKALNKGEATEHQQRLALSTICNKFSRSQDGLYIPGTFDETAFLNGRAFVGQKILKIINLPIGKLINEKAENDEQT